MYAPICQVQAMLYLFFLFCCFQAKLIYEKIRKKFLDYATLGIQPSKFNMPMPFVVSCNEVEQYWSDLFKHFKRKKQKPNYVIETSD